MATKFDQQMSEFFDVEPTSNNLITTKSTEIIPHETLDIDFKKDYIKVRDNFHELIETGKDALDNLITISSESEKSRDFEVAANLLKTVLDANEQLINIHKKVREITDYKKSLEKVGDTQIGTAVFVGSTTELSKMIKEMKDNNIKDITHE